MQRSNESSAALLNKYGCWLSYLSHYAVYLCLRSFVLQNDTWRNNNWINAIGTISHQTYDNGREWYLTACCGLKKDLCPIGAGWQLHCRDCFTYCLDKNPTLSDIVQRWNCFRLFAVERGKQSSNGRWYCWWRRSINQKLRQLTSVTQRGQLAPPLRPNLTSRFKFSFDDFNPSIILLYSSITCCRACCMLSRRAISFCCDSCIFNAWVSSSLRTFFSSFSSWSFFRRF